MTDSELKPMNVPLPKAMGEEGFELSDEQLEAIAGGKLSDQDIGEYRTIMAHYKKAGWTKEKFVAGYDFLGSQQQQEIAALADECWSIL